MKYVNLGCGYRYHPDWTNIDVVSTGPGVIAHDLSRGIPLPDASCDVVYHSNVLEHLRRVDALPFMRECYRVSKPGGVLRMAVPDLERICRLYLEKLEATLSGDTASANDYEWIMLEMYDQTVREQGGGGMLAYLRQDPLPNEAFVYARIGEEGRQLVQTLRRPSVPPTLSDQLKARPMRLANLLRCFCRLYAGGDWPSMGCGQFLANLSRRFLRLYERLVMRLWLGQKGLQALEIGRFRLSGEVHQWMYDRYSLTQLMLVAGFRDPVQQSATQSRIPNWSSFNLDTLPDGTINKPDSLFMEAIRPSHS